MDFAKRQMQKYGWEEGKGLGKNETGITQAIKSSLKFDNGGIGHDVAKDLVNNWWDNVYKAASNNIKVTNDNGNVEMDMVESESVEITTKNYSVREFKKKNKGLEYGTFLKSSKLTASGEEKFADVVTPEQTAFSDFNPISHDILYAACEGRTAHKGARHGIKMSGKLSRLEKQEKMLMKKLQNVSISDEKERVSKKLKKLSDNIKETEELSPQGSSCEKKKKKKKKRKSVSFSETVTEYHTQEVDTSSQSNESNCDQLIILESSINDMNQQRQDDSNFQDEGIEQDCDMRSEDLGQQSFEEVQKSRKEKKKKKKKNMMLIEEEEGDCIEEDVAGEKKKRVTLKFLETVLVEEDIADKYKRKHDEDDLTSKRKKKKKKEASINSIAKSLGKVCKISDTE